MANVEFVGHSKRQHRSTGGNRGGLILLTISLLFHLAISFIGWNHSVNEGNGYRQAQTALVAREIATRGFRLDYEIPVFGRQSQAPFEFPIYQAIVAGIRDVLGVPIEPAGRVVSLVFFFATMVPLYVLARRFGASSFTAQLALTFTLLCPLYLYWSRQILIESTALFFAISFAALVGEYLRSARPLVLTLMFVTGIMGGLTKITTFALAAPVILFLLLDWWRIDGQRNSRLSRFHLLSPPALAGALSLIVAIAWVQYTDAVKSRGPLTVYLTSANMQTWNYGTWAQRLSQGVWWSVGCKSFGQMFCAHDEAGFVLIFILQTILLVLLCASRNKARSLLLLGAFCLGPAIFLNLYEVHGYYWFANSIYYLLAFALLLGEFIDSPHESLRWTARAAVVAVPLLMVSGYFQTLYVDQSTDPEPWRLRVAAFLKEHVPPDKMLLIFQDSGWNPQLSYHSGRRALMDNLSPSIYSSAFPSVLRQYRPDEFGALVLFPGADRAAAESIYALGGMGFPSVPDDLDGGIRVYLRSPSNTAAGDSLRLNGLVR